MAQTLEELDLLMEEIERQVSECEESQKMKLAAYSVVNAHRLYGGAIPLQVQLNERDRLRKFELEDYAGLLKLRELAGALVGVRRRLKKDEVGHGSHS